MPIVSITVGLVVLAVAGGAAAYPHPERIRALADRVRGTATAGLGALVARWGERRGVVAWTLAWVAGLLVIVSAAGFLVLFAGQGHSTGLDEAVTSFFHRGRTPLLSTIWNVITFTGDTSFLVPVALVAGLVWRVRRGDWFVLSLLGGAYLGASVLFNSAKRIVGRERPGTDIAFNRETGLAFPSGHTTDAAAFYTAVGLLLVGLVAAWALRVALASATAAVVLLVATSRLYLGAHWFTDVLAGAVLGTVWAAVLWLTLTSRHGPYGYYAPDRTAADEPVTSGTPGA